MTLDGACILVLEDEPVLAMALEDMLLDAGATPVVVDTLAQALATIGQHRFDAAILDVNVHGQMSYPVADTLAESAIPFVFATGYGEALHTSRFAEAPTVTKPYNVFDLLRALEAGIALAKARPSPIDKDLSSDR